MNGPSGDWPDELEQVIGGAAVPQAQVVPARNRDRDVFAVDVVTVSGAVAKVEFVFRTRRVEVWFRCCRRAAIDRDLLRLWLAEPRTPLMVDQVMLSMDRLVDSRGRVALSLPGVSVWALEPEVLGHLRERI